MGGRSSVSKFAGFGIRIPISAITRVTVRARALVNFVKAVRCVRMPELKIGKIPSTIGKRYTQKLRRGRLDPLLYDAFAKRTAMEARPLVPKRVLDVERRRSRREKQLARVLHKGRLLDELRSFQRPAPRRPMEELLARRFGRTVGTISKDLEALRSLGLLERVSPLTYALTDAGKRGLKGWEW